MEWFDWIGRFQEHDVINLGISGETVEWMLERLPRVIQSCPDADSVFILTGINNVAMDDTGIIKPYRLALREFRKAYPEADIYVISLLPTRLPWIRPGTITSLNAELGTLARDEGAQFIDVHDDFIRHGLGEMLSEDGIHISPSGYAVLSAAVQKHLK